MNPLTKQEVFKINSPEMGQILVSTIGYQEDIDPGMVDKIVDCMVEIFYLGLDAGITNGPNIKEDNSGEAE